MPNTATSVIGLLLEAEGVQTFYKRFTASNNDRGFYLVQLIKRANKTLRFRSGEIRPELWELKKIIDALDAFLQDRTHRAIFTFTKHFEDTQKIKKPDEILGKLKEQNKSLVALAIKHSGQMGFYFSKNRFKQHCQINDTGDIILEEYNHSPETGANWVDIIFNHEGLSGDWIKQFDLSLERGDLQVITVA